MNYLETEAPKGAPLSGNLSPDPGAVWQALAAAAQALQAVASAMGGGTFFAQGRPPFPAADPLTLAEAVNEFLRAKARAGRSDRYLRQIRLSLSHFAKGRSRKPLGEITLSDVENWINGTEWAARTKRGYLADLRTMFNFCIRRGLIRDNPAAAVETPESDGDAAPAIHSPEQVSAVLEAARRLCPDTCRLLAIRYFAGVRSAEAHRLREENILSDRGVIEIPARKAKTRQRRLVTIQPALAAWLDLGGVLRPIGDMRIRAVIRSSRVEWAKNVTRHSFVSYHLAAFQNAGATALEAGHSETMIFKHYRALVTPAAARDFWSIRPASNSNSKAFIVRNASRVHSGAAAAASGKS